MARDHARIQTSRWDKHEWRKLTQAAQHTYDMLLTHPDTSYCGHLDFVPTRWIDLADDLTEAKINASVRRLERGKYVVVDRRSREILVRSFIRHDKILARRNMGHACARALGTVHSTLIREAVMHELARLRNEQPALDGWAGFKDYDPEAFAMACRMASDMASEIEGAIA